MKNVICILTCLALTLCITAIVPYTSWAGTSSGITPVSRDVVLQADVECAVSLNITPATSALPADQHQLTTNFIDNTGVDEDTIDFGSVNLMSGSSYVLSGGGDAYYWAGDDSVNIIGAIDVTITHSCGTAPTATIESTDSGAGSVTVRWSNDHMGATGWEAGEYMPLTTAGDSFTFSNGTVMPVDIGFNVPRSTTSQTLSETVTITVIGGS